MASLFELLTETMPFAGVLRAMWERSDKKFEEFSAEEVKEHIHLLPEGASFYVELPDVKIDAEPADQPLWAWSYSSANPAEIGSVYCRVRDAKYVGHHVADRIAWGLDEPGAAFQQAVRVTFKAGGEIMLPLSKDFVLWTFKVRNGHMSPDQTPLWKLDSLHDTSLVVVFAYDIDPATGQITKINFDWIQDPQIREDVREMERAVKELLADPSPAPVGSSAVSGNPPGMGGAEGAGGGTNPPEPPPDVPSDPSAAAPPAQRSLSSDPSVAAAPEEPWGKRVLKGDFWNTAGAENGPAGKVPLTGGVSGKVGETHEISTEPARLLVVFSFTPCLERADFEPGGIVGFAKCYPHLLVSATVPVEKIEASVRLDRPKEVTRWFEKERDMGASCCKPPYDAWTPPIGGLLVTDTNEKIGIPEPIPFWSNMFDYYIVDPSSEHQGRRFHVVRSDRPAKRESDTDLIQRDFHSIKPYFSPGIVKKEARQGEFDNIHLAPRLRLMNVKYVIDVATQSNDNDIRPYTEIDDRAKWRLDEIVMAPFCAHDCLHLHWRWGAFADAKWTLGWGANGPYEVAGAPMVPQEQDVWLWFRARASVTYHVVASQPRFVGNFHVLMHHGFGYALAIANALLVNLSMVGVTTCSDVLFLNASMQAINPSNSTAAYYWMARHGVLNLSSGLIPRELLTWATDADLEAAIDL